MKTLTRIAAAAIALAVAAPALPCGLMQESAQTTTPAPAVAQAPKADQKAPVKAANKKGAVVQKKTALAKN